MKSNEYGGCEFYDGAYIDDSRLMVKNGDNEYTTFEGIDVGVKRPRDKAGSIWLNKDVSQLHYIDKDGYEKYIEIHELIEKDVIDIEALNNIKRQQWIV